MTYKHCYIGACTIDSEQHGHKPAVLGIGEQWHRSAAAVGCPWFGRRSFGGKEPDVRTESGSKLDVI